MKNNKYVYYRNRTRMFEEKRMEDETEIKTADEYQTLSPSEDGDGDMGTESVATAVFKEQLGEKVIKNKNGKVVSVFPAIPKFTQSIRMDVVLSGVLDLSVLKKEGYTRVQEITFKSASIDPAIKTKEGLTEILNIPETVVKLVCTGNSLQVIQPLGQNIKELDLENNALEDLDFTKFPNLTKLNISYNNFQKLQDLPSTLKYLKCSYNDIRFLDLDGVNGLTDLYANNNKIVSILKIPDNSLKHISYYNNPLKDIHALENIPGLAIHGENGLTKKIQPSTSTVATTMAKKQLTMDKKYVDLEGSYLQEDVEGAMERDAEFAMEGPTEGEGEDTEQPLTYREAIVKYFKLKSYYEKEMKKKIARIKQRTKYNPQRRRMLLSSFRGNCVVCKRGVGSIFEKKNNYYIALCGDVGKSPCRLNIRIFNGEYYNFFDDMHYFKEYTEKSVEEIIKQKMDILFNYTDETRVSKRFEEALKKYTDYNDGYMVLYDKYKEIYENPAKKELIRLKNERVNEMMSEINGSIVEYRKTPTNIELLREAIQRQQTDLVKEIVELRRLKYEEMYVLCNSAEKMKEDGSTVAPRCLLVQNEHRLDKFINMIEKPNIMRFNV
jgi:hypothetical protein